MAGTGSERPLGQTMVDAVFFAPAPGKTAYLGWDSPRTRIGGGGRGFGKGMRLLTHSRLDRERDALQTGIDLAVRKKIGSARIGQGPCRMTDWDRPRPLGYYRSLGGSLRIGRPKVNS